MRLTTKGRFAVSSMIDVALRETAGPVPLSAISQRQHVSLSYLEQLFSRLRSHGLVESTRGPGGGYTLARDARSITLADIITAVDAMDVSQSQDAGGDDAAATSWMDSGLWAGVNARMLDYMRSVSLHSLVEEQRGKGVHVEPRASKKAVFERPKAQPTRARGPNSVFALGQAFLAQRS